MAYLGETLNLVFRSRGDGTFELEVREHWSGHSVGASFVPPYSPRQLNALLKRLNTLERDDEELQEIGKHLFSALCGPETSQVSRRESPGQSVRVLLRGVIQRTLRRRGTVALTLSFAPGCEELVRYPWELLHNGEHFLLASGVFTLTRALLRPDQPAGYELPVHPPFRVLYIGCSPEDCVPLEIEHSFRELARGLSPLTEEGKVILDRLEIPTFDELVSYLSLYGGMGAFNDKDTSIPCYAIHFDGHGAYGRFCPAEDCDRFNDADVRKCTRCGTPLGRIKPQTYLCLSDEEGQTRYIDTQTLSEVFISSDVRLAVFSACKTATLGPNQTGHPGHSSRKPAVDATLATALVMAQVPAVIAMPFSLHDELSPTFVFHLYDAIAQGRTLEEAVSRARQAMLALPKYHGWFIPVLYRHVAEGQEGPVPFLVVNEKAEEQEPFLAHLGAATRFIGREQELNDLEALLAQAAGDEEQQRASRILSSEPADSQGRSPASLSSSVLPIESADAKHVILSASEGPGHASSVTDSHFKVQYKLRLGIHHIALTGPAGIGKSALAFEVARRNREKFPGGTIGISLQGGKSFNDVLIEIASHLQVPTKTMHSATVKHCEQQVLGAFRSLAHRGLPCLLVLDRFDDVQEYTVVGMWHRFLCSLPEEVVVLLTSHTNPETVAVLEDASCQWFEYRVDSMSSNDLLKLFTELAEMNGLAERIHLNDPTQQETLQEICTLLDGYPLGAELIFGRARSIQGKVYRPEAATRSLEEVRDELRETQLEGIWAVLGVAYRLLSEHAQLLLPYLAAFKLPFSHDQIVMLIEPKTIAATRAAVRLEREHFLEDVQAEGQEMPLPAGSVIPTELKRHWRAARDELVEASFLQFDGRLYHIHAQIRQFAHALLPREEHQRVHRVAAAYYSSLAHPTPDQWFAAFEHLEEAGEPHDLQEAVHLAIRASWDLRGRGRASQLLVMLRRAELDAQRLGDKTGEGQVLCCLGAIFRQLGRYAEARACLSRSLSLHNEQNEPDEAGWALYELVMLFREEGQLQQAQHHIQEAMTLFRNAGDPNGLAWMQMVQGEVIRGYGHYHEALEHFDQVLASFRDLPSEQQSDEGYAWVLRDRGTVYEALGRYAEALADYEEAMRLFTTRGLRLGQAWVLTGQSSVYLDQGKFERAERTGSEAIAIFREQGARRGEGWALGVMGDIARRQRNFTDAESYYKEAAAIFTTLGDLVDQARLLNALGAIAFEQGAYPVAKDHYERAQVIAHGQEVRQVEGRALRGLGDLARAEHQYTQAEDYYRQAIAIATELDTPSEQCAVLHRQGELRLAQEQYLEALDILVQALALDRRIGHPERKSLEEKVQALVSEHHLERELAEFSKQYGLD